MESKFGERKLKKGSKEYLTVITAIIKLKWIRTEFFLVKTEPSRKTREMAECIVREHIKIDTGSFFGFNITHFMNGIGIDFQSVTFSRLDIETLTPEEEIFLLEWHRNPLRFAIVRSEEKLAETLFAISA